MTERNAQILGVICGLFITACVLAAVFAARAGGAT